ncbi:hypothetical protein [Arthrobacter sp. ZGTC212]|uniref:hypothetical protein n=1 Tax=Arthrobacter sp. ZGTC212 TaxID=2058899 RepID=UPI0011AFFE46|nr:hypothetical protein [Arthrobacter sp. ZGTC212]
MEPYAETCSAAITHTPSGRGGNEEEIIETVLCSLRRVGYQTAKHPLYGFGSATGGMPDVSVGTVITVVRWVNRWISERLEEKRQRAVDALLPRCVVQLSVTANDGTHYGTPNLAAELVATLPAVLADLKAADYRRRYTFMIYASAPEYVRVTVDLSDDNMSNKDLLKVARACAAKPAVSYGPAGTILNLWFVKKHWWIPKKLKKSFSPDSTGVPAISGRGPRYT